MSFETNLLLSDSERARLILGRGLGSSYNLYVASGTTAAAITTSGNNGGDGRIVIQYVQ